MAIKHETPVLVVGAGPVGLLTALQLSANNVPCILVEQRLEPTKYPKMDITNCRSMEILRKLGVSEGLREVGVPPEYKFDVLFSTGLTEGGKFITKWDLPSVNDWHELIQQQNDGSMPREPPQRGSQIIFEAWLRPRVQESGLVTPMIGYTFESLVENDRYVETQLIDSKGEKHTIKSQFVIGCDGAHSAVRESVGIKLLGEDFPLALLLIHCRSRDLTALHKQGRFWHIFFSHGGAIISQDEIDTWTVHCPIPIDTDVSALDPIELVKKGLGGCFGPLDIQIDEILVTNRWVPGTWVADRYISSKARVFIAGDAAHQNAPTGGYGMNTGMGDGFDIGWKIAAVLHGHGGPQLLQSYEEERLPVAQTNVKRAVKHLMVLGKYWEECKKTNTTGDILVASSSDEGKAFRDEWVEYFRVNDNENRDHGIELGYRYNGSSVVVADTSTEEPPYDTKHYIPSTWPGARAPHVFLKDGKTSIFDLLGTGPEYTLVDFTEDARFAKLFNEVIESMPKYQKSSKLPLKTLSLPESQEPHVRKVWERNAVLVRPDQHVAWRASPSEHGQRTRRSSIENAVKTASGWMAKAK